MTSSPKKLEANDLAESEIKKHNVIITGFGLFRDHNLNPSWEAIKDGRIKIHHQNDINIITRQIAVSYQEVDHQIPLLWEEYKPLMTIHVGLAAHENAIRIEQVARHGPYINDDVVKHAPHKELRAYGEGAESLEENRLKRNYKCKPCEFDCSSTCINIDRVCDRMNKAFEEGRLALPTRKSDDAGLYVCEYIYQKSLRICERCVFIHVPNTSEFKLEDITAALQVATESLVDEVLETMPVND